MPDLGSSRDEKLRTIPGTPPDLTDPPKGDAFAARNPYAMRIDYEKNPPMFKVSDTHMAKTWRLHPNAPKTEIPEIIKARYSKYNRSEEHTSELQSRFE